MKEMDVDGSDSVDWMEFKKHYKVAMKMEEKAKEYLKKFIDQGD
jgi:Ca2+-binding EF-hand superfamily protein